LFVLYIMLLLKIFVQIFERKINMAIWKLLINLGVLFTATAILSVDEVQTSIPRLITVYQTT